MVLVLPQPAPAKTKQFCAVVVAAFFAEHLIH